MSRFIRLPSKNLAWRAANSRSPSPESLLRASADGERAATIRHDSHGSPLAAPRARSVHDSPSARLLAGGSRRDSEALRIQRHRPPRPRAPRKCRRTGRADGASAHAIPRAGRHRSGHAVPGSGLSRLPMLRPLARRVTFRAAVLPPSAVLAYSRAFPGFGVSGAIPPVFSRRSPRSVGSRYQQTLPALPATKSSGSLLQ